MSVVIPSCKSVLPAPPPNWNNTFLQICEPQLLRNRLQNQESTGSRGRIWCPSIVLVLQAPSWNEAIHKAIHETAQLQVWKMKVRYLEKCRWNNIIQLYMTKATTVATLWRLTQSPPRTCPELKQDTSFTLAPTLWDTYPRSHLSNSKESLIKPMAIHDFSGHWRLLIWALVCVNVYSWCVERVGPVIPLGLTSDSFGLEKGICLLSHCCQICVVWLHSVATLFVVIFG